MRKATIIVLVGWLLLAVTPLRSQTAEGGDWTRTLTDPDADPTQKARTIAALRVQAAGRLQEPGTRAATTTLALYWAGEQPAQLDARAVRDMAAAATLFPDEPGMDRVRIRLAETQAASGDLLGARLSLTKLMAGDGAELTREFRARAVGIAARSGDHAAALAWAESVDRDGLDPDLATVLDLALVKAGVHLGHYDVALQAVERLARNAPETLRLDPDALLAAARTYDATGRLDAAIRSHETFVNLYPGSIDHAASLAELGGLLARSGRPSIARRYLEWLTRDHPGSVEADQARLRMLELGGGPAQLDQLATYLELIRHADSAVAAVSIAERMLERFIAAGHACELLTALSGLATESAAADSLAASVGRQTFEHALEPALALLDSRGNDVGIAAASIQAEDLGVGIPLAQAANVERSRAALGLPPQTPAVLQAAIDQARRQMSQQEWSAAAATIRRAFHVVKAASGTSLELAMRLRATALWRAGEATEALAQIDEALIYFKDSSHARKLLTLQADVLFSEGQTARACGIYDRAAALADSRWVQAQRRRCTSIIEVAANRSAS